jgi:hypothetical protein
MEALAVLRGMEALAVLRWLIAGGAATGGDIYSRDIQKGCQGTDMT